MKFEAKEEFARSLDKKDPLRSFRSQFHLPKTDSGQEITYLCGNSLGLQPKNTRAYIEEELAAWEKFGVEGHFHAKHPWFSYHEVLTEPMARVVGGLPIETVVMNSLTVNLHLLMVSFYRPTSTRYKILIEKSAFPSDQYAVASQAKFHGFDPKEAVVELKTRPGEETLRTEDILKTIEELGESLALVMLGGVNYLTGQAFDLKTITEKAHQVGAIAGYDLAHAAGNLELKLHDWNVDFAAWCSYKYLNSGPGSIAGAFVHERHAKSDLPRFAGWWGQNKKTRFQMLPNFDPIPGAEGWQLSNPPIFQMAALRASLEVFDAATMSALRKKGDLLTGYLEFLLESLSGIQIVTPRTQKDRGNQLSLRAQIHGQTFTQKLAEKGIIADFREPDIVRVAPAPLYNSFLDVYRFSQTLTGALS